MNSTAHFRQSSALLRKKPSMAAFKHYYRDLGNQLWYIYGPRDASIRAGLDFAHLQGTEAGSDHGHD